MPTRQPFPPAWTKPVADWRATMRRQGIRDHTVATRSGILRKFATAHPDPWAVAPSQVAAWLEAPERWAPTQPNPMRSTLHTFYGWATQAGRVMSNPAPRHGVVRRPLSPAWAEAIDAWTAALLESGTARATARKRAAQLTLFATTGASADPWAATYDSLSAYLRVQDWAPTTLTAMRATLRTFYAWAASAGRIATNPAEYLTGAGVPLEPRPVAASGPLPHLTPADWLGPMRLYTRHLHAQGRARTTIHLRMSHLNRIARDLDPLGPWSVTFDDLVDWLAAHDMSASSRRTIRQTLRGFYGWALDAGHTDDNPADRLPVVHTPPPNPRPAPETAIRHAMAAAAPRERLMIRLAAEVGLRAAEVAQVHTRDLLERDHGWSLLVHGKGSRTRMVPLPHALAATLQALPSGYAFPSPHSLHGHLTAGTVASLVGDLLPEGVTMHTLRHRFASRAYELERDLFTVQRLLGHSDPATTQRYVATTEATMRATVDGLAAWAVGA